MDQKKISYLHNQLKKLQQDRIDNRLDYMEWELYAEQNQMRLAIQERFKTGHGPNVFVIFGGNRSGKTELGAGVIAEIMRDYHDKRIWVATLSDLSVKVQQKKIYDLLRKKDIEYGEYNLVRGWKNNTIISKNKSVIYFKTFEQGSDAYQGDTLDAIWLDEECSNSIYQESIVRLADRKGIAILTFTALEGFTRLVTKFWKSDNPNHKTCVLTPFMNPFISDDANKQLLDSLDEDEIQSRWEGEPHIKEGRIFKTYNDDHRIDRFDYVELVVKNPNRWKITEGIDPHERTPHHWLRFLYDNDNDILYVVEEISAPMESMLIRDFSLLIKSSRKQMNKFIQIDWCQIDTSSVKPDVINVHPDEDQTNVHTVRREFQRNGINTILCTKDNNLGLGAIKSRLKIVKTQDGTIKKKPSLYLFKDLKGLNLQMNTYVWDSYVSESLSERKEMVNRPKKKDDHFIDILKYECIKRLTKYKEDKYHYQETEIYEGIGY
tara:strand:+ start:1387 stop:2859 length:1473 start_codon:yes stop_codon:yes gene_type:complete